MNAEAYLEAFLEETGEQLQALEERLIRLEKNPGDRGCLDEIFRLAHTLKGNAATVGLKDMAELAHRMEDLLGALRRGAVAVGPEVVDALLNSLDALKGLAKEAAGHGGCGADLDALLRRLERLAARKGTAEDRRGEAPCRTVRVRVELAGDCAMPAARAYVVLRCLEELGDIAEARPALADVEGSGFGGREIEAVVAVRGGPREVADALAAVPEVEKVRVLTPGAPPEVRVRAGSVLDPETLAARLAGETAARTVLDLTDLRELGPAGLEWLLSLKGAAEIVPPRLPAGRRFFELLAVGGFL